jgi:hypothetical protein
MEYSVDIRNVDEAVLRFRAVDRFADEIKDALRLAGEAAADYMKVHVPFYSGALYRAIFTASDPGYRPGGAGGGGFYEMRVGVDETQAPHADAVIHGTGIFSELNFQPGIFPKAPNTALRFPGTGNFGTPSKDGMFYRAYVRGQEAQTAWFENAMEMATQVVESELYGLDIDF